MKLRSLFRFAPTPKKKVFPSIFAKTFIALVALSAVLEPAHSQSWNVDADGTFNTAGNWNPASVPTVSQVWTLGNVTTATRTITMDVDRLTAVGINFSSIYGYNIVGNGSNGITFATGSTITVNAGTNIISSNALKGEGFLPSSSATKSIVLNGGSLDVQGGIALSTADSIFSFSGTGGTLQFSGPINLGASNSAALRYWSLNSSAAAGNVVVSGVISSGDQATNSVGSLWVNNSGGYIDFTAANTMGNGTLGTVGGLVAVQSGEMRVSGIDGAFAFANSYTLYEGGTLNLYNTAAANNGDRLSSNGKVYLVGGELKFSNTGGAENYSESAAELYLGTNASSAVTTSQADSGQTSTLTFESFNQVAGSTVLFSGTGLGQDDRNKIMFTTLPTMTNGVFYGAAINDGSGYNLATYDGTLGVKVASYLGTSNNETTWANTTNVKPTTDITLTANRAVNGLVLDSGININADSAKTLFLGTTTGGLTGVAATLVQSGGTSVIGSNVTLSTGTNGSVKKYLMVYGTLDMQGTIASSNANRDFVKSGSGTLNLAGNSSATWTAGSLEIREGVVRAVGAGSLGSSGVTVEMSGTTLQLAGDTAQNFANPVTLQNIGVTGEGPGAQGRTATFVSDRITAGAGVTHTLGQLADSSAQNISLTKGANVTSGIAGLQMAYIATLSGSPIYDVGSGALLNFTGNFTSSSTTASRTITKTGDGTLAFAGVIGDNSAGKINMIQSAGTLLLNGGNTGTGTATVNGGALGGTGTVSQAVTVNSGGAIMGGDGTTGTTTTVSGSLTMNTGSAVAIALGAGGAHSTLARTGGGAWNFQGNQAFSFLDQGAVAGTTYSGIITGLAGDPTTTAGWTIANSGWTGTFAYNGGTNSIDFTLATIPEPTTLAMLGLGLAGMAFVRRRKA